MSKAKEIVLINLMNKAIKNINDKEVLEISKILLKVINRCEKENNKEVNINE